MWGGFVDSHCIFFLMLYWPQIYTDILWPASCQRRWRTNWIHMDLFLAAEQWIVGWLELPITTKRQSVVWPVSQSRHMSDIVLGSCLWLHLRRQVAPRGFTIRSNSCIGFHEESLNVWWSLCLLHTAEITPVVSLKSDYDEGLVKTLTENQMFYGRCHCITNDADTRESTLCIPLLPGVPWRQPHSRSGLATLPSVGAIP